MHSQARILCILAIFVTVGGQTYSQESAPPKTTSTPKAIRPGVVRIGAIAYKPEIVTVFRNLTTYLARNDFESDFVLYSNHESLIAALARGEVEIAWLPPVAHAKFHLQSGRTSKALAMRDVDTNLRVTLVARDDAKVTSIRDLRGKRLLLGNTGNAEGALLPMYYVKQAGIDPDSVKVISLSKEAHRAGDLIKALQDGRGDAVFLPDGEWKKAVAFQKANPDIKSVWSSPQFCHCSFTAAHDFDKDLSLKFTRLVTGMNPKDPLVAELMKIENTGKWLPANQKGYEALYDALEEIDTLLKKR
jgi:phosphonate transport system substrate-binding protein